MESVHWKFAVWLLKTNREHFEGSHWTDSCELRKLQVGMSCTPNNIVVYIALMLQKWFSLFLRPSS